MIPLPNGERRLMRAVLVDALRILGSKTRRQRRREVIEWMNDPLDHGPFAFETICQVLGLDPGAVRNTAIPPSPYHRAA